MIWNRISMVVPVGPQDSSWTRFHLELTKIPPGIEVIFCFSNKSPRKEILTPPHIQSRSVESTLGRAYQMNQGARVSEREFLWFIHSDSQFTSTLFERIENCVNAKEDSLFFCDLKFLPDGPLAMKINEWGGNFRSRFLKMPFGDQGFFLKRELFLKLGSFEENSLYGEDHLLIWSARRAGVPIRPVGAPLLTSARRYRQDGWIRATASTIFLTWKQALPEWGKMRSETGRWI